MTSYATAAELRARLDKTSVIDDTTLTALLAAATEAINNMCGRPDGFLAPSVASSRMFPGSGQTVMLIDECVAVTLVEVKESATDSVYNAWTATDWVAFSGDPRFPNFTRLPFTSLMVDPGGSFSTFTSGMFTSRRGWPQSASLGRNIPTVRVTAKWGYAAATPAVVREACIAQAARWYKRGLSGWADTVGNSDLGTFEYRKVVDPDIEYMLVKGRLVRIAMG